MTGRKQHYIPQCLLAGFEASRSGKRPQVFVYRRSSPIYLSWIGDVAAQRDFYSSPAADGVGTLDDKITSYENRLGPMLARMRERLPGLVDDNSVPAELVAHLCVRSAFIRNYFDAAAQELISGVGTFLSDRNAVRTYLRLDKSDLNPLLLDELDKAIDSIEGFPSDLGVRTLVKRLALFGIREEFDGFYEGQTGQLGAAIAAFRNNLPAVIRQGHGRALITSTVPPERLQGLTSLRWWKIQTDANLILPDCIAISRIGYSGAEYAPYLTHSNDELQCVLVPIDSHQLLVACRGELPPEEQLIFTFNRIAASCSIDFFVSAVHDRETDEIAAALGEVSERSVADAVRESFSDFSGRQSTRMKSALASKEEVDGNPHTYAVSFVGDIDILTAQAIANIVKTVVDSASDSGPLRFLDQVIFAADYGRALAELDRGFEASEGLTTTSISYGTGVAMAPLVVREGKTRCVLVMRSWIGDALLEGDTPLYRFALHTLVCMVARVKYMSTVHGAFPDLLLNPIKDPWDAFFIRHTDSVSSAYFGARESAHIDPDFGEAYRTLFRDSLASAAEIIPRQRLAYRTNANLDEFLRLALGAVSDVLTHAASALGHFDALEADLFSVSADGDLEQLLQSQSLLKWAKTYQRDLQQIYETCGEWESTKELLAVSIHVERLLWAFGVFPWRTAEGAIRVDIPLHTDIAALQARAGLLRE